MFRLSGAHDISLEGLTLKGGGATIDILANSGNTNVTLKDLDISGFSVAGVRVGQGSTGFNITGSHIHDTAAFTGEGLAVDFADHAVVSNNDFSNVYYGVFTTNALGLTISQNTFETIASQGINTTVNFSQPGSQVLVVGNTVTGSTNDGIFVNTGIAGSVVRNNIVTGAGGNGITLFGVGIIADSNQLFGNAGGLEVLGSNTASNNQVHNNTRFGIETAGSGTANVIGNIVTANPIGILINSSAAVVRNNLLIGNALAIDNESGVDTLATTIQNNTFDQTAGIVVKARGSTALENNIIRLSGGAVFDVTTFWQNSFSSDWNLFNLAGTASVALWGTQSVAAFLDWRFGTGFDTHSITGDPSFIDAVHGNYHLQSNSPAIDAGDPTSTFAFEPGNNGGRINLGFDGNTAAAAQSASQTVQVISPNGLDKLTEGTPTTITFRTDGISGLQPIILLNSGGPSVVGSTMATNWQASPAAPGVSTSSVASGQTVDVSGSPLAAPAAVYADSIAGANGAGNGITQSVAVPDGAYIVRLHFAEYSDLSIFGPGANVRQFDIKINGVTVATNFDIFAQAGNKRNTAVVASFAVNVSAGQGISVELVTDANTLWGAQLAGLEVDKVTQGGANQTAKVEASPDNGQTWELVSASVPISALGTGSVQWTPDFQTKGNTALIRVTAAGVVGTSNTPFLVAPAGHDYYINDASTVGDEYTIAVGNDLNSGKTADAPMASVAALVRAYNLGAGDIVHIDTGNYTLLSDVVLSQTDSGDANVDGHRLTFQGPTDPSHTAVLNRADIDGNIFIFTGADDVVIKNLTLSGAKAAVNVTANSSSNNISLNNVEISANFTYGVFAGSGNTGFSIDRSQIFGTVNGNQNTGIALFEPGAITNTEIFGEGTGISANGAGLVIDSNVIHGNTRDGIDIFGDFTTGAAADAVTNNQVFGNGPAAGGFGFGIFGISATGPNITVSGNHVFGQNANGETGILTSNRAVATGNVVFGNYDGILVDNAKAQSNRVFSNSDVGISISVNGGTILDNRIYSNGTGIKNQQFSFGASDIEENLIYANNIAGISLFSSSGNKIIGNTISQSVGSSVILSSAINTKLIDNIFWSDVGTIVSISSDSLSGIGVSNNLYWRGKNNAASVVNFGGTNYTTLADWQAAQPLLNSGSVEGDPKFINIAGSDNVLGGLDTALGGGADDNFTPGKFSPAIDAGNAFVSLPTDLLGQPRHDDPAVANTGIGPTAYDESDSSTSSFTLSGTLINGTPFLHATNYFAYTLPFTFNFFGTSYTSIELSPTGFISFNTTTFPYLNGDPTSPSLATLESNPIIAPFWAPMDMSFGNSGTGFYVEAAPDHVTIRWATTALSGGGNTPLSNVAVRLGVDGSIRFDYGANLTGLTPVIGLSDGTGINYSIASISGQTNLSNAPSITFTPNVAEGRVYYDIGAIEFQGSSSDVVAPTVVAGSNLPAEGGSTDSAFTSIALNFSEALDQTSATSVANYQLVEAGADGKFDTPDDVVIALAPTYAVGSSRLSLGLVGGPLPVGHYRLTVSPNSGILDTAGNPLDGDGNGTAGGAFVRTFFIDRSQDHPPVVADETVSTPSGTALAVTLVATSPDNDPLTYGFVSQPKHGTIQNFDPVAGTFTYVPSSGFVGTETIGFFAQDNKLGQTTANLTINVTAVNQAPVAAPETVIAFAGRTFAIALQGYDLETPENQLTLVITSQPQFGTLVVTGQNTVTYTSNTTYSGSDQFTYAWRDTGSPAGTLSNALTGASAAVSITVLPINHAPATQELQRHDARKHRLRV